MLRSKLSLAVAGALAAACLAGSASSAAAGDPIMPLSEVRAGMACTGYSVVRGTTISTFDVAVQDVVVGDAAGGGGARILVRVSGPAVDATGVGQGFSGSPIYCPGSDAIPRVIGAISEGIGEYGGHVALATPIEAILGEQVLPPVSARSAPRLLRRAVPLAMPLSIAGLSGPVAAAVRRAARRAGRDIQIAPLAPRAAFPVAPMVPGAAVAVGLASGDIAAAAVGTVSYVDGDVVWAFGHPLDAAGRRGLFLQDAYVYAVVNNPLGLEGAITYKLAAPGHDLGVLSGDGSAAVVGRIGALPTRFPLRVLARDLDTGRLEVVQSTLADERPIGLPTGASALSTIGPLAVAQAAYAALRSVPARQSGSMCVRIEVRQRRAPLRFCNTYVGGAGGGADLAALTQAADLSAAASLLDAYDATPLQITRVEANLKLRRGLRQAFLLAADGPAVVRRGSIVRVRVLLRRPGGRPFVRAIRVPVPLGLARGEYDLTLTGTPADGGPAGSGADSFDISEIFDFSEDVAEPAPTTLSGLARAIAGLARYDGVTASFREPGADPADSDAPERRVYRDPLLRVSGEVAIPVTVVGRRTRRG